jgi:hypothetical protein
MRLLLPNGRQQPIDHGVCKGASNESGFRLHQVQVCVTVASPDRDPGDEMVKDEVVQDHDSGLPTKLVHDPSMCLGVVSDVVEVNVRLWAPTPARRFDHDHVEPLAQGGDEQGAVVRYPGSLGRKR